MVEMQSLPSIEPEKIDEVTRQINLTIPGDAITTKKMQKLQKIKRTSLVDGFRKGKTPLSVVDRMYGKKALTEAVEDLCWGTWQKVVDKYELKPLGQPRFSVSDVKTGEPVTFQVSYEVIPEIVFGDYSKVKINKAQASVIDDDINKTISAILENNTSWHVVDIPSCKDDAVIVDFTCALMENSESETGAVEHKRDNERLVLSDDFSIPELRNHLIGVSPGERVECEVTFPDTFDNPEWKGKVGRFVIDVKSIEQPQTPELDDAFAHRMGISSNDESPVASFREQVRKNLNLELQSAVREIFRTQLLQSVVNKTNIPVPATMIDYCNRMLRRELAVRYLNSDQLKKYGDTPEDLLPAAGFVEKAKSDAAVYILMDEISRQRNISATDDEIRAVAEELAIQYDDSEKFVQTLLADKHGLEKCRRRAVEDKIIQWLEAQVQITEVNKTYTEIMEPDEQAHDKPAQNVSVATKGDDS